MAQPLPATERRVRVHSPRDVEFGILVHQALELGLREGEVGFVSMGPPEVQRHVRNANAALRVLGPARRSHPEWRVFGERDSHAVERRIDLLRELEGDVFQIVDYKTDALAPAASPRVAAEAYRLQLAEYRDLLEQFLAARGRKASAIRTYICFTAPDHLTPQERLVEV